MHRIVMMTSIGNLLSINLLCPVSSMGTTRIPSDINLNNIRPVSVVGRTRILARCITKIKQVIMGVGMMIHGWTTVTRIRMISTIQHDISCMAYSITML